MQDRTLSEIRHKLFRKRFFRYPRQVRKLTKVLFVIQNRDAYSLSGFGVFANEKPFFVFFSE